MAIDYVPPQGDKAERQGVDRSITMENGTDTYAGRMSAWHRMGNVIGRYATYEEIEKAAKADFDVVKVQLDYEGEKVPAYAIYRVNKDGSKVFLAQSTESYGIIHHSIMAPVADALVGSVDGAHYETMGTLNGGRKVWFQVDPNLSINVGDDKSDVLLTFVTSHDGTTAAEIYETIYRVVCRNSLRASKLNKLAAMIRVKHTKNAAQRFESMADAITEMKTKAMKMQDMLQKLASRQMNRETADNMFDRLFPRKLDANNKPIDSTRRDGIITKILARYEENDNNTFPEQRGTAYNLLNAITGYVDHERSSKGDGRNESATFGSGDALKTQALTYLVDTADGLQEVVKPVIFVPPTPSGILGDIIETHHSV